MELTYHKIPGWFNYTDSYAQMASNLPDEAKIVEIGSFLGRSTHFLCTAFWNANKENVKIYCIDTWEGSGKEHAHFLKKPNYFYNVNLNSDSEDKVRKAYINSIMADDLSFRKPYLTKTKEELVNGRCNWPKLEQLEITTHTKQI